MKKTLSLRGVTYAEVKIKGQCCDWLTSSCRIYSLSCVLILEILKRCDKSVYESDPAEGIETTGYVLVLLATLTQRYAWCLSRSKCWFGVCYKHTVTTRLHREIKTRVFQ